MEQEVPFALFAVFAIAVAGGVATILLMLQRGSKQQAPEEEGKTAIFSERCGGRVGRIRYTGPLVRVSLYDTMLVVSARTPIVLQKHEIVRVTYERDRHSAVFGKTVNIHHRSNAVRSPICLYSSKGVDLARRLNTIVS